MKRVLCFVLVATMLVSLFGVIATATTFDVELQTQMFDYFGGNEVDWSRYPPELEPCVVIYDYVVADEGVLFVAIANWRGADTMEVVERYDKWCVYSGECTYPSNTGMYVKVNDNIYTLKEAWEKGLVTDLSYVEGFSKYTKVYRVGDVDLDFDVSILDATLIQQEVAKLAEFNELQDTSADVDGDGDTSVLDATSIQLELAKV